MDTHPPVACLRKNLLSSERSSKDKETNSRGKGEKGGGEGGLEAGSGGVKSFRFEKTALERTETGD